MDAAAARWQRIRAIFDRAVECEPAERAALVDALAAGDEELRQEVIGLLDAFDRDADLFERPAAEALLERDHDPDGAAGRRIGNYRLLRTIGRGGMGSVFEAVRADEHFEQRVAVKLINRAVASEATTRRFLRERQILARLDHPNIARLLDGGITGDGQPYLVMEYVDGRPIDEYCDERRLAVPERLRLFRRACDAVQYAHRNLIVHRDLKPSNILVTADAQVKLLDFGIAKLLEAPDTDAGPTLTLAGAKALTPAYASPEQIRGEPISTASDVYSLGVILYELLCGRRPFAGAHPMTEARARALDTEPPPPSAVVDDVAARAAGAGTATRLRRVVAGELDNIVLMALRAEPERRYRSAEQLSEDVRHHLEGLPVLAQRDSAWYRARKFLRRHRAAAVAAAVALVTVAAGVVSTASQARRAEAARALAESRSRDVRELATSLLFEVHDAIADLPGSTPVRALLVERGIGYLDRLLEHSAGDPGLRHEVAAAYLRLGRVQGQPTGASLGDLEGARRNIGTALEIAQELAAADPQNLQVRRTLALAHEAMGDVEAWAGDVHAGIGHAGLALDEWTRLAAARPDSGAAALAVSISQVKLGDLLGNPNFPNLEDRGGASERYRAALATLEAAPDDSASAPRRRRFHALIQERLGTMHRLDGRHADALAAFEASFAVREAVAAANPTSADALRDVAVTHQLVCEERLATGDAAGALGRCEAALDLYRRLRDADPGNAQALRDLAIGYRAVHEALAALGRHAEARAALDRSTDMFREVLRIRPDDARARRELQRNLGG